jgi:hypothetical protein
MKRGSSCKRFYAFVTGVIINPSDYIHIAYE